MMSKERMSCEIPVRLCIRAQSSSHCSHPSAVGIVRLTIHQAKDLDSSKSLSGDLNPFAKINLGGNPTAIHTTPRFKHTNNPVWESATEFLCSDRESSIVTIKIIDDRD